jgi:hypothetical protein
MEETIKKTVNITINKSDLAYLKGSGLTMTEVAKLYKVSTLDIKEAFARFNMSSKAKAKPYIVDYVDDTETVMSKFTSKEEVEPAVLPESQENETSLANLAEGFTKFD